LHSENPTDIFGRENRRDWAARIGPNAACAKVLAAGGAAGSAFFVLHVLFECSFEIGLLLGAGLRLKFRFPNVIRHAVKGFAPFFFGHVLAQFICGFLVPAAQTIATKPSKVHHVDILDILTILHQVFLQPAKCGGFDLGAGLIVHVGSFMGCLLRLQPSFVQRLR
jgi:hypothetical protein